MDITYPISLFMDGKPPKYAHNAKEAKTLRDAGWHDNYRNLPHQEYPRSLYDENGNAVRAEDADHEAKLTEEGYSRTPVAKKEEKNIQTLGESLHAARNHNTRIDVLEKDMAEVKDGISQILLFISAPKGKPGRKKKVEETDEDSE